MGNIGVLEIVMIAFVFVVLFGANRIASLGKGLGDGIKGFREAIKDDPVEPRKGSD